MSRSRHTRPPPEAVPEYNGLQLSGEDYENIWLRIKDRGAAAFYWFIGLAVTFGTLIGGVGGYGIARNALEVEVQRYAESVEFRKSVIDYTRQQMPDLDRSLQAIEGRADSLAELIATHQANISALGRSPLEVDSNGARWTASYGRSLRLEAGQSAIGFSEAPVKFSSQFQAPPMVLVSFHETSPPFGRSAASTYEVTAEGFRIRSLGVNGVVNWVAIGH